MSRELFRLAEGWAVYEQRAGLTIPPPVMTMLRDAYYMGATSTFKALENVKLETDMEFLDQVHSLECEVHEFLGMILARASEILNMPTSEGPHSTSRSMESAISSLNAIFKAQEKKP